MIPPDDKQENGTDSFIDRMRRSHANDSAQGEMDLHSADDEATAVEVAPVSATQVESTVDSNEVPVQVLSSQQDGATHYERGSVSEATQENATASAPETFMPAEARRALVLLMRQGVLLASRKGKVFEALVRNEAPIRKHLAEVYLQLVLDERAGVAFIASRESAHEAETGSDDDVDSLEDLDDDPDGATLITRRTLSLYDTLLLLVLRKYYQDREVAGEQRIIIDTEKVESGLVPFLPLTNSERSDRRKLNAALGKMVEKRLLARVRGSDERFEITPVIRYVVSAEFLESLLVEYGRLAGGVNADSPQGKSKASTMVAEDGERLP